MNPMSPFSLVVKTGAGLFGSPISSSMLMSAEFNLIRHGNPSFMLHFKPQFWDFSIKKLQSSVFYGKLVKSLNGAVLEDNSSIVVVERPFMNSVFMKGVRRQMEEKKKKRERKRMKVEDGEQEIDQHTEIESLKLYLLQ